MTKAICMDDTYPRWDRDPLSLRPALLLSICLLLLILHLLILAKQIQFLALSIPSLTSTWIVTRATDLRHSQLFLCKALHEISDMRDFAFKCQHVLLRMSMRRQLACEG